MFLRYPDMPVIMASLYLHHVLVQTFIAGTSCSPFRLAVCTGMVLEIVQALIVGYGGGGEAPTYHLVSEAKESCRNARRKPRTSWRRT